MRIIKDRYGGLSTPYRMVYFYPITLTPLGPLQDDTGCCDSFIVPLILGLHSMVIIRLYRMLTRKQYINKMIVSIIFLYCRAFDISQLTCLLLKQAFVMLPLSVPSLSNVHLHFQVVSCARCPNDMLPFNHRNSAHPNQIAVPAEPVFPWRCVHRYAICRIQVRSVSPRLYRRWRALHKKSYV